MAQLWEKSTQYMNFYCSLSPSRFAGSQHDCQLHIYLLNRLVQLATQMDEKLGDSYADKFNTLLTTYHSRGGQLDF